MISQNNIWKGYQIRLLFCSKIMVYDFIHVLIPFVLLEYVTIKIRRMAELSWHHSSSR